MIPCLSLHRAPRALPLALAAVLAVAGTAAAQVPAPTAKASDKEYALAHNSSFDAPASGTRNPFWPIGWTPSAAAVQATVVQQLDVRAENFVVTTISVDYPPLAIINGHSYGVGDQIPVGADKKESVTVKQILDGVVVLAYHGRELRASPAAAALRRTK